MPILLFAASFAVAFVASLVVFGCLSDGDRKASRPVLKGALTGIALAAAQYFLLVAGSQGEGALLAPVVGIMLVPPALLGGLSAGVFYGLRGKASGGNDGPEGRNP